MREGGFLRRCWSLGAFSVGVSHCKAVFQSSSLNHSSSNIILITLCRPLLPQYVSVPCSWHYPRTERRYSKAFPRINKVELLLDGQVCSYYQAQTKKCGRERRKSIDVACAHHIRPETRTYITELITVPQKPTPLRHAECVILETLNWKNYVLLALDSHTCPR
jgi:hypothetical protein